MHKWIILLKEKNHSSHKIRLFWGEKEKLLKNNDQVEMYINNTPGKYRLFQNFKQYLLCNKSSQNWIQVPLQVHNTTWEQQKEDVAMNVHIMLNTKLRDFSLKILIQLNADMRNE